MLVTYPDVVSGGFTVVRNDSGVMRAHFGFVLNADDPHACITGYRSTGSTRQSRARSPPRDTRSVACDVINGADPNPGDSTNESGSNIRGEQNIGRSGGVGGTGPQSTVGAGTPHLRGARRRARRRCCTPTPSPARWGESRHAAGPDTQTTRRIPLVTSDARALPREEDDAVPAAESPDETTSPDDTASVPEPEATADRRRRSSEKTTARRRPRRAARTTATATAAGHPLAGLAPARPRAGRAARPAARRRGLPLVHPPRHVVGHAPTTTWTRCRPPGPASST